jgi:hypothetical protein
MPRPRMAPREEAPLSSSENVLKFGMIFCSNHAFNHSVGLAYQNKNYLKPCLLEGIVVQNNFGFFFNFVRGFVKNQLQVYL